MTIRITKDQKIGGVAAKDVRDILRKLRIDGWFSQEWIAEELYWLRVKDKDLYKDKGRKHCLDWLKMPEEHRRWYRYYPDCCRHWNASRRASASFIKTLIKEGLIELDKKATELRAAPRYKLSERGEDFRRATAAKPLHSKSGDEAIQGFMERVNIVNEGDRFLFRVTAVVLYGSYLRGAERPADVDLAIEIERKIADFDEFHDACWKHLDDKGRACRRIAYELEFPREEVFVFLRQRKRTLSLHPMYDFIGMKKHDNFSYEVLFGDKDEIAQRLAEVAIRHEQREGGKRKPLESRIG